ncbi:MAG: hypothetical protein GXY41_00275 [Phycisphaerae bacterium]|nr:hypothetical protein [Phycisphaerae bacterium]
MSERIKKIFLQGLTAVLLFCLPLSAEVDRTKYITLDEVRTDMEAYALTVWYGTEIEKFPLKILSVVRNREPGNDMILVVCTDERFRSSGAIHGNSGSPVYIDGRLAGALAAGWDGSLEPLYLVRPIEDMLKVGTLPQAGQSGTGAGPLPLDLSAPLDLTAVYEQAMRHMAARANGGRLPLPLATSLPAEVCRSLAESFVGLGFSPLPSGMMAGASAEAMDVRIEPGSVLAAVLCSGDINLAAVGTATEVIGDTVYGFGHSFKGIGQVEIPMAAGKVHAVVPGRDSSFKFASPGPILGTIEFDQNAAVRGRIGIMPTMIPMEITISRFNDTEVRTYRCQLAMDREYTPQVARVVAMASALMQGPLPDEHAVRYNGRITVEGDKTIAFDNLSSGSSLTDVGSELLSTLTLLLSNPFEQVTPKAIEINITVEPDDQTAAFWSARLSQTTVKPGQTIKAEVTLQTFRQARTTHWVEVTVPDTMPAGKHTLHLLGAATYNSFLTQNAPQRLRVVDTDSLLSGLDRVLNMPRNRLYAVLPVPATGLTLRRFELPDLPPTRMLLMQDSTRLPAVEPYRNWIENSVAIDKIVAGGIQIELTVEQP